jgi:Domain of unknown function (DUF4136)
LEGGEGLQVAAMAEPLPALAHGNILRARSRATRRWTIHASTLARTAASNGVYSLGRRISWNVSFYLFLVVKRDCALAKEKDMSENVTASCSCKSSFRIQRSIVAVFVLMILSVSVAHAQDVSVEFDQSIDFSKYKTFAVRDGQLNSKEPALNSELTKKNIQTEIEKALVAKGLTKVESGRSDLNVVFQFGSAIRMDRETYPAGWRGLRTRVVRTPENAGTLVINLRDPSTRSLVWRSVATETEPNPSKLAGKLDDMVKKSIAKYPPKK